MIKVCTRPGCGADPGFGRRIKIHDYRAGYVWACAVHRADLAPRSAPAGADIADPAISPTLSHGPVAAPVAAGRGRQGWLL